MAMLVERSTSALSVDYLNPKDNSMMDAEICRLFGSLNLAASAPIEQHTPKDSRPHIPQVHPQIIQPEEDMPMAVEAEMTISTVTDGEGNVQVSAESSRSGYPFFEIYEPKQFIESSPSPTPSSQQQQSEPEPQSGDFIEGCGLVQLLAAHYAPRISRLHCATRDPDFNLLETVLAHREQFVAFPYGHRSCSSALTKVAFEIERRNNAGQPYQDDPHIDTAIALHNEAWLMSGWYSK